MANYNKLILVGRLTRDPVLKYLPSQMAVTEFGIVVNNKFKTKSGEDREEAMFMDCSCFGKGGEIINQYCTKGAQLMVDGRVKYETWEDKQGGGKRSKHILIVENFQLMGNRDRAEGGDPAQRPPTSRPPARPAPARQPAQQPYGDDEQQFKDEDIPF